MIKKNINALFLLFIIALPFSWANIGSMSIYRLVTIIVFLIWLVNKRFILPIPVENDRRKLFFAWISYVAYSILAIVLYPSSVNVVFGMILLLMISFIFFSSSVNETLLKYIDYMWLAAAVLCIVLFFTGRSMLVMEEWETRETLVILGTKTDANEFTSLFVVSLPVAMHHFLNEKGIIKKIICFIVLVAGLYVVLMGGSRGALISLVVALVITVCSTKKISPRIIVMVLLIGMLMIVIIPKYVLPHIPQETLARLSLEALQSDGGSGRSQIWVNALHKFGERNPLNWIFGCGYGGLTASYLAVDTSTMHNQYLQQLVSYGILGTVLYLRLIYLAFMQVLKRHRRYLGAFIGIMVMAMTLTFGPSYKILWIMLFMAGISNEGEGGYRYDSCNNDS